MIFKNDLQTSASTHYLQNPITKFKYYAKSCLSQIPFLFSCSRKFEKLLPQILVSVKLMKNLYYDNYYF